MKIKEVREMDAKTLAETKENLQEKLAQMKLNRLRIHHRLKLFVATSRV